MEADTQALPETQESSLVKVDEVAMKKESLTCSKCGLALTMETMCAPKSERHKGRICKPCSAVTAMLRRHIGEEMPDEWQLLSPDLQKEFFANVVQAKESSGPLSYKTVRAELVKSLSNTKLTCQAESVGGGFFPLEYWTKQGFPEQLILEGAPREEHAFLGTCYQVPIHYKNYEQRVEQIERSILSAERGLKRKKDPSLAVPKGKAAKALAEKAGVKLELPAEQFALKDDIAAVIDLESDSDDENLKARRFWLQPLPFKTIYFIYTNK